MKYSLVIFSACISLLLTSQAKAQHHFEVSLFPGYHVINSDEVTHKDSRSDINPKTNFILGGVISFRSKVKNYPMQFTIGYTYGKSNVHKSIDNLGPGLSEPAFKYDRLKYSTIPIEAFWVHSINEQTELFLGINTAMQHRIMEFETYNMPNDRLLSFGAGLSGKIQTQLKTFQSNSGYIFGSLSFRWTEYLIHDSNGRDLDDFTLRHVTLSPQIGVAFNID